MNAPTLAWGRRLFLVSALFNLAVALGLAWTGGPLWPLLGMAPPVDTLFLHLFVAVVVLFGAAYFWIARDPAGQGPLIVIGAAGKVLVFVVVGCHWLAGSAPALLLPPAVADLVFAVLFLRFARQLATGDALH